MAIRGYGHIELPDLARYSDTPLYNTKAVVQQTGVQAATLRAWERRYELLAPQRAGNAYRLYSERDVATIRWLKSRVDGGMAISQAVALFHHMLSERQQLEEAQKATSAESPSGFHVILPQAESPMKVDQGKPEETALHRGVHSATNDKVTYNMLSVRQELIEAFIMLDETAANALMASMLAIYPFEQVSSELIVPVLWEIGKLWEEGDISVSVEHFASNFLRGLLTNLFHVTPEAKADGLVLVCCAPGEAHEIAPLLLALCLRRAGLHVAYLGQSIETSGLLHTIKELIPALVCVSLTIPVHLPLLIDLAQRVQAMRSSHPIFAYGGQVFERYPQLITEVPGRYVHGELIENVDRLRRMVERS
jgi:DNA-binding transcriptional MerR regulator